MRPIPALEPCQADVQGGWGLRGSCWLGSMLETGNLPKLWVRADNLWVRPGQGACLIPLALGQVKVLGLSGELKMGREAENGWGQPGRKSLA